MHRAPAVTPSDRTRIDDISVTALPRTLIDLAVVAPHRLGPAIERAEQLEVFDLKAVDSLLVRCKGHHGAGRLRRALASYREPAFTRSELEDRFLTLVRQSSLPKPSINHFITGHEIDVYWARERFGVELDTYDFHGGRAAFERDRIRQEELKLAGIEIVRITGRRVDREPDVVIDRLATLLARRRLELA